MLFIAFFLAVVAATLALAPMEDFGRTAAYVLLVETPVLILLAMATHAYNDWRAR